MRWWRRLFLSGMILACLHIQATTAQAYGLTECPASRYGDNLGCTAGDVSITGIRVIGDTTSCTGGSSVTLDLELTVNFANPARYDIGIFISNNGRDPQLLAGAATCSVGILPKTSPFMDIDSDTCGDGQNSISGVTYMPGVTLACQSIAGGGGNLYIPFVVSWDNGTANTCTTIADPVPNTKSKCNAPTILQGSVAVVVLPTITISDGVTFVNSGDTVNYTVVITNTTGVTLSGAVFRDPAVTNITVNSVGCSSAGGASCPAATVADMQGAGITIPDMPAGGSVTFTINATLSGSPPDALTNTASVTVNGQTTSAGDTDTIVGAIAIIPSSLSKFGTPSALVTYAYTLYNFGALSDTISLSASSNNFWSVASIPASIALLSGGSANFTVTVQIPAGAAVGTVDATTITATSGNDPTKKAMATAVTTVGLPLTLTPNNTAAGGQGAPVFYSHRVQNNTAATRTANFSVVYSGPDCGSWTTVLPAPAVLAPFGGYADVVVRVNVPAGAAIGSTCAVTITANTGLNTTSAVDTTTVRALVLYYDPGYTIESYILPAGNSAYARVFGTLSTNYRFLWYDSGNVLRRTSPSWSGPGTIPDAYDIPVAGPLGAWRVEVRRVSDNALFTPAVIFYVGPDHISASYTGPNPVLLNSDVTITLSLHDRNHVAPLDSFGNLVRGNPPTTKDPLQITVTLSGAATIVSTTLTGAVIVGQTVTGRLDSITGTATITIRDGVKETVAITPSSVNAAVKGSPARDEPASVTYVNRRMRILFWREMAN